MGRARELARLPSRNADTKAGTVAYFGMGSAPDGWLKCNGAAVSRTTYADLFTAIGTTYGSGDGSTTFNVPELRGEFMRGLDDSRGVDTGRALGSAQSGQNASHTHGVTDPGHAHTISSYAVAGAGGVSVGVTSGTTSTSSNTTGISIQSSGGTEARPRNVAMLACIKF